MTGILFCVVGILGVALVTGKRGRAAGLALTAFFAASAAFFVMPPAFSFRIDRLFDLATLIGYGLPSLITVHLFHRSKRQEMPSGEPGVMVKRDADCQTGGRTRRSRRERRAATAEPGGQEECHALFHEPSGRMCRPPQVVNLPHSSGLVIFFSGAGFGGSRDYIFLRRPVS